MTRKQMRKQKQKNAERSKNQVKEEKPDFDTQEKPMSYKELMKSLDEDVQKESPDSKEAWRKAFVEEVKSAQKQREKTFNK